MRLYMLVVDKQTYVITVAPGVDAALLLAICICLVRLIAYSEDMADPSSRPG
jgi:hypothetical protein